MVNCAPMDCARTCIPSNPIHEDPHGGYGSFLEQFGEVLMVNTEIARELHFSKETVKTYSKRLNERFGTHDRT